MGDDTLEGGSHKRVAIVCLVHMRVGHVQSHVVYRVYQGLVNEVSVVEAALLGVFPN